MSGCALAKIERDPVRSSGLAGATVTLCQPRWLFDHGRGTVGGGDLGIHFGYQRFMPEVILIAVNHRLARRREGR